MPKLDITFDKGLLNGFDEKRLLEGGLFRASGVMFLPNDPQELYKQPGRKRIAVALTSYTATAIDDLEHSFAVVRYVGDSNPIAVYSEPFINRLRTIPLASCLSAGTISAGSLCADTTNASRAYLTNITSAQADWLCGLVKAVPTGDNRWVFFNGDPGSRPLVRDKAGKWYYLGLNKPSLSTSPTLSSGTASTIRPSVASSYAISGKVNKPYLDESDWQSESFLTENLHIPASAWNYDIGVNDGDVSNNTGVVAVMMDSYMAKVSRQELSAAFGISGIIEYFDRMVCSAFTDTNKAYDGGIDTYSQLKFTQQAGDEPHKVSQDVWNIAASNARVLESKGKTDGTHTRNGERYKRWNGHWYWMQKRQDFNDRKQYRVGTATWVFTAAGSATSHTLYVSLGSTQGENAEEFKSKFFIHVSLDGGTTWNLMASDRFPLTAKQSYSYSVPSGTSFASIRVKITGIVRKIFNVAAVDVAVYDIKIEAGEAAYAQEGEYRYAVAEVFRYTDPDGRIFDMESEPSSTISADVAASTANSTVLTLPATPANTSAHGLTATTNYQRFYRIYRSTSTGGWPDLGYIASAHISGGTYVDNFALDGSTLGSPPLPLVFLGLAAYPACVKPPNFKDACLFRGSIVAIPADDPTKIIWSVPGRPYAFPAPYSLKVMPDNRNDELIGVATVNDALVLFGKNRVLRLLNLPFTANPNYEENRVSVDTISLTEGIQHPLNYCLAYLEDGTHIIAFVSRNGIYATDGSVAGEGGQGLKKLTPHIDWDGMVEPTRLARARLFYDPNTQIIHFDYDPKDYSQGMRLE